MQLETHKVPTYDVENTNGTNKRKYLFLTDKRRIVPRGTERITQRIQMHRTTLYWSIHPQQEQDKTEKSGYGLDWLQKDMIWFQKAE